MRSIKPQTPPPSNLLVQELLSGANHIFQLFYILVFFVLTLGCNNGTEEEKYDKLLNNLEKINSRELEKQSRFVFTQTFYRYSKLGDSCYSESNYFLASQYYEKAVLLSDSLYKHLQDSLAGNILLYQDDFCSIQYDRYGLGVNKERRVDAAVKSEHIDFLINLIQEGSSYYKCNGNDTNFYELRKNPILNVFINKAVNIIQQERYKQAKEEEKKYTQPLKQQSETLDVVQQEQITKAKEEEEKYIQQLDQQSEILEKQTQRESIKIYFIFLFIPISSIILLFLKIENTKNIILNILLVCNTLLFLYPVIGALFESQSGLHWLYIILLPLCFIIQLVLVILKIVFYATKKKT